jgi:hypothetical protein
MGNTKGNNGEGNAPERLGETPGGYIPPSGIYTREQRRQLRTQQREQAAQRRCQAWALRLAGVDYRSIGKALGVSTKQAFEDCRAERAELRKVANETTGDRKDIQLAQLEKAKTGLAAKIANGDTKAVDSLAKLIDLESRISGTMAPAKHAILANVHQHNTFELDEMDRADHTDRGKRAMLNALTDEERRIYFETVARLRRIVLPDDPERQAQVIAEACTLDELRVMEKGKTLRLGLPAADGTPALPLLDGEVQEGTN